MAKPHGGEEAEASERTPNAEAGVDADQGRENRERLRVTWYCDVSAGSRFSGLDSCKLFRYPLPRMPPMAGSRATFPKDFVWGSATSAYQIEGAAHEDGRGESIWDRFSKTASNIKDGSNGDVACDHYHRWRDDIALLKRLGHAAYRFSIAWPRICPTGRGPINQRGIDFYSRLVDGLLENKIEPYVTLFHWDLPQALQDQGGWPSRSTAEAFADYADVTTRHLGDRVKHWITHNEPWCSGFVGHQKGNHAPGLRNWRAAVAASHHLLLSHGWAVPIVRQNSPGAEVGIALNLSPSIPASSRPADHDAARRYDGYINRWFLEPLFRGAYPADILADYEEDERLPQGEWIRAEDLRHICVPTDFLGINYYNRHIASGAPQKPEQSQTQQTQQMQTMESSDPAAVATTAQYTDIGWEVYAPGMFEVLVRVHLEYRVGKVYVTENGASYNDGPGQAKQGKQGQRSQRKTVADARRVAFLREHLLAAHRAMDAGVPLSGYFVWSLMDNYEWDHGYTQRFGLSWVDYRTQERIPKDSADWYRKVIEESAVPVH
jgi:beta-glucosidase